MFTRSIKYLLLACVAYWVTGAALYVHERLEHADSDGRSVVLELPQAVDHSQLPAGDKPHDRHNHDDCPTCQLLAHMTADGVTPPAALCAHLPCLQLNSVNDRLPPIVDAHCSRPIRGPPVGIGFAS